MLSELHAQWPTLHVRRHISILTILLYTESLYNLITLEIPQHSYQQPELIIIIIAIF